MKQYIKPCTTVLDVSVETKILHASGSISVESVSNGHFEADVKERDVWKDGFWD